MIIVKNDHARIASPVVLFERWEAIGNRSIVSLQ